MLAIPTLPGNDVLRNPRPAAVALLAVLGGTFLVGLGWSCVVSISISATGQGRIVPAHQVQVVQNLEGGIVEALDVKEGDKVKRGQRLARIQDAEFAATYHEAQANVAGLRAQVARLTAEVEDVSPSFPKDLIQQVPELVAKERSLYASHKAELTATISAFQDDIAKAVNERHRAEDDLPLMRESLRLALKQKAILQPQVDKGMISAVEVLSIDQKVVEFRSKIAESQRAIPAARAAESQARNHINTEVAKARSEALSQLTEAKVKLSAQQALLTAQKDRVTRRDVLSPVNGVVKHLDINTVGGVVRPGENILEIVPSDDDLIVEARFSPKDIAFIHPGLPAYIRVTAYDPSIYGELPAEVVQVSADATVTEREEVYYILRARASRNFLGTPQHPLPLIPGMVAQVDVVTGKRTLFDYLIKPISKLQYTALHER